MKLNEKHPMYNQCYVVAEALYHIWGKYAGLRPVHLTHEGVSHWWLQHETDGQVVDLTKGQFKEPFPYNKGRHLPFLTKTMSKRTRKFLGID